MKNYYEILGVGKQATAEEIKAAYRRMARVYHPDCNQGDREKEAKFKEVAAAWEVLGEPERRAKYDLELVGRNDEARAFVERGAVDALDWITARAQEKVGGLGKYGEKGRKAAKAAELGLDVGKEVLAESLRRFIRNR